MIAARSTSRHARAFTLAELLVAVAAVLLLTIGIGQLFSNVGKLVSTGAAVSEVDQLARAIEAQLRSDFDAMSNMGTGETLLAIRSRKLGDMNGDGVLDDGEKAVYLTLADLEADERDGLAANPYQTSPDATGNPVQQGRGVTVRLDEVLFLAFGGDQNTFLSAQEATSRKPVSAHVARVYYGHGLKPRRVNLYYDTGETSGIGPVYPARPYLENGQTINDEKWIPDGDFGDPLRNLTTGGAVDNSFDLDGGLKVQGRNEFAGDFTLVRHTLLLKGGIAAGYAGGVEPAIGEEREIAVLARDGDNRGIELDGTQRLDDERVFIRPTPDADSLLTTATLIAHGRTDICAQSPESLKRWLEGFEELDPTLEQPLADASPLDGGIFDTRPDPYALPGDPPPSLVAVGHDPDQRLWDRDSLYNPWPSNPGGGSPEIRFANNLAGLQSAIAGMFVRPLVESDPPTVDRIDREADFDDPGGARPEDALMDVHAMLAARCSHFEIAWSDGTIWADPVEDLGVDLDEPNILSRLSSPPAPEADIVYKAGDIIWFDAELPRRALAMVYSGLYPQQPEADPEILPPAAGAPFINERDNRLVLVDAGDNAAGRGEYDPFVTRGAPVGFEWDTPEDANEYLAIWGYRIPDDAGGYLADWVKPKLLRFRITLHDAQFRIEGGKTFEFIVSINTK